jgi:amino acid transporter
VSGSAYTYAYVSFGELFAWIIGWALIMEYSIGNIYIAFSWSGYFTNLVPGIPEWLTTNYIDAQEMSSEEAIAAWKNAPMLGNLKIIFDLPAVIINVLITALVYIGTKESKNFSNAMVVIKLAIIALVISVGFFYIDMNNWEPFMPNGFTGVMAGVSAVFFAYIGFDAVSTLAEESKNPQRDLPRGMIYSLIICTAIYIVLALILTGMVSYELLGVDDPLAEIFKLKEIKWMLWIVSIAAVVAMTSVLLVFQMGQPRIWMTMSRDGLMPEKFGKVHPRFKTPGFATIVTGFVVGVPLFFTNEKFILDFTSIGTLFAFILVCGGVLVLPRKEREEGKFHLPYINSKYIFPLLTLSIYSLLIYQFPQFFKSQFEITNETIETNLPMLVFFVVCIIMMILSYIKEFSLIPVLGLVSCCYLLTGMAWSNWKWFFVWMLIGLVVYFSYGYRKSKLAPSGK